MKHLLFLCFTLFSFVAYSQDLITTKKGEDIQAKVLEINTSQVKYKKTDNLEGPTYTILKSDVLMIRYANGSKDIFAESFRTIKKETMEPKQEEIIVEVEQDTIKKTITQKGREFYLNGQLISGGEMKSFLYKDPEAKRQWKGAQGFQTGQIICSISSGICLTTSAIMLLASETEKSSDSKQNEMNYKASLYPLVPALVFMIPAGIFNGQKKKLRLRAIETYNRNQEKKFGVSPIIGTDKVGLVIRF